MILVLTVLKETPLKVEDFLNELILVNKLVDIVFQSFVYSGWNIDEFVKDWSITQYHSIPQQLRFGARFLDFRPSVDLIDGKWKLCHSSIIGSELAPILQEIQDFLTNNPSEFVIIDFRNFRDEVQEEKDKELIQMLESIFGEMILRRGDSINELTLGEMVDLGKQILILIENSSREVFNASNSVWINMFSRFLFNSYANADNYEEMARFNEMMVNYFKTGIRPSIYMPQVDLYFDKDALFILSWTQTGNTIDILKSLVDGNPASIFDLTKTSRIRFSEFYKKIASNNTYPFLGNIFLFDFLDDFTSESILKKVINFK